jgi:hypothetical protein
MTSYGNALSNMRSDALMQSGSVTVITVIIRTEMSSICNGKRNSPAISHLQMSGAFERNPCILLFQDTFICSHPAFRLNKKPAKAGFLFDGYCAPMQGFYLKLLYFMPR